MKILAIRVLAWNEAARLPQRIDFIKDRIARKIDYEEVHIEPIHTLGYYLGYIVGFLLLVPKLLRRKYDILFVENAYLVLFGFFSRLSGKKEGPKGAKFPVYQPEHQVNSAFLFDLLHFRVGENQNLLSLVDNHL